MNKKMKVAKKAAAEPVTDLARLLEMSGNRSTWRNTVARVRYIMGIATKTHNGHKRKDLATQRTQVNHLIGGCALRHKDSSLSLLRSFAALLSGS